MGNEDLDPRERARPLRSVAFAPANRGEVIRAVAAAGPDGLVLDLEDGTPAAEKGKARERACTWIAELAGRGLAVFARVNALASGQTGDDLEAVVCTGLHGVFLPKVENADDVIGCAALLAHFERRAGLPAGQVLVNPLMESAWAIRNAHALGLASRRVAYMGGAVAKDGDQARAIGYQWTPEGDETLYLRSRVLLDARAAGVPYPLGGMWTAIDDPEGLRRFALQTRRLGYTGMMVAHYPGHVPAVNEIFTPTAAELAHHREVIRVVAEGEARGEAMQEKDGHIVDPAMVKLARDRLELARRLGVA
jgi:citrate lyase subunit beta/citryl-CoA lyase